jgi:predicted MFS family arabinose efflux permease
VAEADGEGDDRPSPRYSNYVLGVLFLAYVFNFIDRQIPAILLVPIQDDLGVSDAQMGLLTGTAFALFYATLGIPIARLADVGNRRNIIALGLALWSLMTAASGLARSFGQLALARIGVGVGEAARSPPAHSLIADYFPPERRATALGIYSMGIHIGILFGVLAGGWLQEFWGWRIAFIVVGLPGLLLSVVLWLTVREPPRAVGTGAAASASIGEVIRELGAIPSFRHLSFATGLTAFGGYAFANWAPAFLMRVHAMSPGELGTKYGLVLGIGGAIGSVLAGLLADRLGRRDVRFWLWIPALATVAPLPFLFGFYTLGATNLALTALFPGLLLSAMYQAPVFSTVQTLAKPRMRAVASGVLLFVINIIGLGLGPPTVGILNDTLFAAQGDAAVGSSLLLVGVVMGLWGCVHYLLAARTLRADLHRAGAGS